MGIPAGFVFADGEYHLFYRYAANAQRSGGAVWGHAVSKNLLNWVSLPDAVMPDSSGNIIPGSVVFDSRNASGLGTAGKPALIAFYILQDQQKKTENQDGSGMVSMAYSLDKGRTWIKGKGNPLPVTGEYSSGPKVFWHEATRQWILCLASDGQIAFYGSPDAMHWKYSSHFSGSQQTGNTAWQFPDLFPLQVKGSAESRWVLLVNESQPGGHQAAVTKYFIGDFDGHGFKQIQAAVKNFSFLLDYGEDFFAGIRCSNAPGNRSILTGLMDGKRYMPADSSEACRSSAAFPRQLNLIKDGFLYLLTATPVSEINQLYGRKDSLTAFDVPVSSRTIFDQLHVNGSPVEIRLSFDISKQDWIGFPLSYGIKFQNSLGDHYTIKYENDFKSFSISRNSSGSADQTKAFNLDYDLTYRAKGPVFEWRILLDHSSVEFFADSSKIAVTNLLCPSEPFQSIELFSERSPVHVLSCSVTGLKPI